MPTACLFLRCWARHFGGNLETVAGFQDAVRLAHHRQGAAAGDDITRLDPRMRVPRNDRIGVDFDFHQDADITTAGILGLLQNLAAKSRLRLRVGLTASSHHTNRRTNSTRYE